MKIWKFLESKRFFVMATTLVLALFLTLAYKNPFSDRSIIPNLEPFPDSLLYSLPAWNLIKRGSLDINAFGFEARRSVPLLYGLLLSPFMWLFSDIRGFYYGNLLFGLVTLVILMLTVSRLLKGNNWRFVIAGLIGFLLATNYFFYVQPQLLMTENVNFLLLTLFLFSLTFPILWRNILFQFIICVVAFSLKISNTPIVGVMAFLVLLRVFIKKVVPNKKILKPSLVVFGVIGLAGLIFLVKKMPPLNGESYNIKYFGTNFNFYLNALAGNSTRYLWWFSYSLYSKVILWTALLGLAVSLVQRKFRLIGFSILMLVGVYITAFSLFRDTEGRYMDIMLPLVLILSSIFIGVAIEKLKFGWMMLLLVLVVGSDLYLPINSSQKMKAVMLKEQIGMNLRHREDPWNYLAMEEFNKFFSSKEENVYFGTLLPPFYVDIYANGNYNYLPISKYQEFPYIWQKEFNSCIDMVDCYKSLLESNNKIYVSDYYINGSQTWKSDYIKLMSAFDNKKVFQSPLDNCNIYELSIKKSEK